MTVDLDITIKTDRELTPEEQEYHEFWINQFKGHFDEWFLKCGIPYSYSLHFNIDYFADKRKFTITYVNRYQERIFERIRMDDYFYNRYFVK